MKNQCQANIRLTVYSIMHFLCDLCCCATVFQLDCPNAEKALCVLIYNFCAFAMQYPIGLMADITSRNCYWAAGGAVVVVTSPILSPIPLLCAAICGLGNAAFHIGGGTDTLNSSGGKSARQGIFVAPGAFGVFLGCTFSGVDWLVRPAMILMLLLAAVAFIFFRDTEPKNSAFDFPRYGKHEILWLGVGLLFAVVTLRGFGGLVFRFEWKAEYAWYFVLCVVFGKILGGFVADKLGGILSSVITLLLAGTLFLFGGFPLAGLAAILLFNMTMPVTLTAVANLLPGAKGGSFGLMSLGLFLGYLPTAFGVGCNDLWVYGLMCVVSLALIIPGLKISQKYGSLRKG